MYFVSQLYYVSFLHWIHKGKYSWQLLTFCTCGQTVLWVKGLEQQIKYMITRWGIRVQFLENTYILPQTHINNIILLPGLCFIRNWVTWICRCWSIKLNTYLSTALHKPMHNTLVHLHTPFARGTTERLVLSLKYVYIIFIFTLCPASTVFNVKNVHMFLDKNVNFDFHTYTEW